MGTVITLYAGVAMTGSAQSNVASIPMPTNGNVVGVYWSVSAPLITSGATCNVELSFLPNNMLTSSNLYSVISRVSLQTGFVTSGLALVAQNVFIPMPLVKVVAGQYIYLHQTGTNSITPAVNCQIFLDASTGLTP